MIIEDRTAAEVAFRLAKRGAVNRAWWAAADAIDDVCVVAQEKLNEAELNQGEEDF